MNFESKGGVSLFAASTDEHFVSSCRLRFDTGCRGLSTGNLGGRQMARLFVIANQMPASEAEFIDRYAMIICGDVGTDLEEVLQRNVVRHLVCLLAPIRDL